MEISYMTGLKTAPRIPGLLNKNPRAKYWLLA